MSDELRPCPFCGSAAKWENGRVHDDGPTYYQIVCTNKTCAIQTPNAYDSQQVAALIERWNTRAEPDHDRGRDAPIQPTFEQVIRQAAVTLHSNIMEEARVPVARTTEAKVDDLQNRVAGLEGRDDAIIARFETVVRTERDARRALRDRVRVLEIRLDAAITHLFSHDDRLAALEAAPVGVELNQNELVRHLRELCGTSEIKKVRAVADRIDPSGALWKRVQVGRE